MNNSKNILFIMTDQLRADCLSCAGNLILKTPNIDRLAEKGVRFTNCFTTSAICTPARASISTGRYLQAHRVWSNETPWPEDEKLMGDHLRDLGVKSYQCGKSHYTHDALLDEKNNGIDHAFRKTTLMEPFPDMETIEYNDGWNLNTDYRNYLMEKGYAKDFFNWPHQVLRPDGSLERWKTDCTNSDLECAIKEDDTDTAFTSYRALDFLENKSGEKPWMFFLSYYRPHQPYCASGKYYRMYKPEDMPAPLRSEIELDDMHPLIEDWFRINKSLDVNRNEQIIRAIRSSYYGLVAEIDDWLGEIFKKLDEKKLTDKTMIIFTSDHGDYLGDHYLRDKTFFYDQAYRVPLLIYDPSSYADSTRGTTCDAWVQSVDILPTMIEYYGGKKSDDIQGDSILPFVRGEKVKNWRNEVYAAWYCRRIFDNPIDKIVLNVRDSEYNYWFIPGMKDILFDLKNDPNEFHNISEDPLYKNVVNEYRGKILSHQIENSDLRRTKWRQMLY